mmetsp:Transcript_20331/g.24640  ORF Transcript_20331/g.24640 Transcript_20331/m.24640 type:complete len:224 (+) Transcript_20331:159-830(+)
MHFSESHNEEQKLSLACGNKNIALREENSYCAIQSRPWGRFNRATHLVKFYFRLWKSLSYKHQKRRYLYKALTWFRVNIIHHRLKLRVFLAWKNETYYDLYINHRENLAVQICDSFRREKLLRRCMKPWMNSTKCYKTFKSCFQQWKFLSAQLRELRACLSEWIMFTEEKLKWKCLNKQANIFHNYYLVLNVFLRWKKSKCMYKSLNLVDNIEIHLGTAIADA